MKKQKLNRKNKIYKVTKLAGNGKPDCADQMESPLCPCNLNIEASKTPYVIVHFNSLSGREAFFEPSLLDDSSQTGGSALLGLRVTLFGSDQVIGLATFAKGGFVLVFRGHLELGVTTALSILLRGVADVDLLDVEHVVLLGSEHATWASDTDPADEGLSGDLVVLHGVEANERTGTAKSCLAVNGDGTGVRSLKVLLNRFEELVNDRLGRCGTICEDHVFVVNALTEEGSAVVFGLVEANNLVDIQVLENVDVASSGVAIAVNRITLVNGAHEGKELAWDNPVKVTVLDLLVVLVFTCVEGLEVVPSKVDGPLQTLEAVLNGAFVGTRSTAGISEVMKVGLIRLEMLEGLLGVHAENDDHESAHQVG